MSPILTSPLNSRLRCHIISLTALLRYLSVIAKWPSPKANNTPKLACFPVFIMPVNQVFIYPVAWTKIHGVILDLNFSYQIVSVLKNSSEVHYYYSASHPTIPVQTTIMVSQHYQNSLLSPCFLPLNPSPIAARMMLFKCKSSHVIPLVSTQQWLSIRFHATSKILACPTSLH